MKGAEKVKKIGNIMKTYAQALGISRNEQKEEKELKYSTIKLGKEINKEKNKRN